MHRALRHVIGSSWPVRQVLSSLICTLLVTTSQGIAQDLPSPISTSDFVAFDPAQAAIGQHLFYDPILSGNRNISCGTCHHHDLAGGDGLPLGIGEGGTGLGADRIASGALGRIEKRVPRNAPSLFNLGHTSIDVLFHDGRLSVDDIYGNGFNSPAEEWLPQGLDTIVAAQALFPITSEVEMAGSPEENEVAGASYDRIDNVWPILAKRVRIIPEYGDAFVAAFDAIDSPEQVTIVEIANALSAFITSEWRSYDSPFDAYLTGDTTALTLEAQRGVTLFYADAGCATCHSGPLLTDQAFHALALPHFGPGRTRRHDPYVRDLGRMGETDDLADAYRFRTPSLRNVALTAPYGHNGAYATLEGIVRHHLNPVQSFDTWSATAVTLPDANWLQPIDFIALQDSRERGRLRSQVDIAPQDLSDADVNALVAFLTSLTGTDSVAGRLGRPDRVPSNLPVEVRND